MVIKKIKGFNDKDLIKIIIGSRRFGKSRLFDIYIKKIMGGLGIYSKKFN